MQISAKSAEKICKIVQKYAFFAYETLVLLKKTVKIDVSTHACVQ